MTTGVCPKVPVTNSYSSHSCLKPPSRGSNGSLGPGIKKTADSERVVDVCVCVGGGGGDFEKQTMGECI